jgi:putative CocE/NonD family hydrolase
MKKALRKTTIPSLLLIAASVIPGTARILACRPSGPEFTAAIVKAAADDSNPFRARDQKAEFKLLRDSSLYIPMKDGVRIAIDAVLPQDLPPGRKLPAIMKITRYGRGPVDGSIPGLEAFWAKHGFASVMVDERGTGASFGSVRYGKATLDDTRAVVDWIVQQPWSNGRIGAIGGSYEGTTSELLAATGHPAVRAVAPLFSDYNYYADLIRPGGILNERLIKTWHEMTAEMDAGTAARPVETDKDRSQLKQAIAEHRSNPNVYEDTMTAEFSDDTVSSFHASYIEGSIPGVRANLERSRVPMLIFASWFDAGTVQGTLQRFRTFGNAQTIYIGAWNHGGSRNANPFVPPGTPPDPAQWQQFLEALAFFNHYLKDPAVGASPVTEAPERRLWYYTIGENQWHSTDVWPPAGLHTTTYNLSPDFTLSNFAKAKPGDKSSALLRDRSFVPPIAGQDSAVTTDLPAVSTGDQNRWLSQVTGGDITYTAVMDQIQALPAFTTAPLNTALEITGQPVLRLQFTCSGSAAAGSSPSPAQFDPWIFAYLTAIDPQGKAIYLTEGQLRLIDRKLSESEQTLHTYTRRDREDVPQNKRFEGDLTLFPISALIPAGYRLRLSLAANDKSVFASSPPYKATIFAISKLELPVRQH